MIGQAHENEDEVQPKDGGPAFPQSYKEGDLLSMDTETHTVSIVGHHGMSLRQWYAGLAMQALITRVGVTTSIPYLAFDVASAMIEEGNK